MNAIWSSLTALTAGSFKLFHFYTSHFFSPYFRLPPELYNEYALSQRMSKGSSFDLVVDRSFVDEYNSGIDDMADTIKRLWGPSPQVDYRTKQIFFWLVRIATIVAAFSSSLRNTFYISLVQFLVLPYSLFVALGYGSETVFVLYTGHTCVFPLLEKMTNIFLPHQYNISITINPTFLIAFLAVDQILCAVTLFYTPNGKPEALPAGRIWQSVWYGFLNCKTYYLILLPLCFGTEIPLIPWILDYSFGISNAITKRTMRYWGALFYHAHKMGHIPIVYLDAHRFHHHLHDTTSFDAHIFGSGAPEEWLILVADVFLVKCLGIPPAALSPSVLVVSWFNKWGFHTRTSNPIDDGENMHAYHHSLHVKNFGITYPYDILMGTAMKERITWAGYEIFRVKGDDGDTYKLRFVATGDKVRKSASRRSQNQSLTLSGINFAPLEYE